MGAVETTGMMGRVLGEAPDSFTCLRGREDREGKAQLLGRRDGPSLTLPQACSGISASGA